MNEEEMPLTEFVNQSINKIIAGLLKGIKTDAEMFTAKNFGSKVYKGSSILGVVWKKSL